jgi:hypothetical protein
MEQPSARPQNGRPLQSLLLTAHYGFVEAVPSHVLRDGTGTSQIESRPTPTVVIQTSMTDARMSLSLHLVWKREPCNLSIRPRTHGLARQHVREQGQKEMLPERNPRAAFLRCLVLLYYRAVPVNVTVWVPLAALLPTVTVARFAPGVPVGAKTTVTVHFAAGARVPPLTHGALVVSRY